MFILRTVGEPKIVLWYHCKKNPFGNVIFKSVDYYIMFDVLYLFEV